MSNTTEKITGIVELQQITGRHKAFRTFIKLLQKDNRAEALTIPTEHQEAFSQQIGQLIGKDMPLLLEMARILMEDVGTHLVLLHKAASLKSDELDAFQKEVLEYLSSVISND